MINHRQIEELYRKPYLGRVPLSQGNLSNSYTGTYLDPAYKGKILWRKGPKIAEAFTTTNNTSDGSLETIAETEVVQGVHIPSGNKILAQMLHCFTSSRGGASVADLVKRFYLNTSTPQSMETNHGEYLIECSSGY